MTEKVLIVQRMQDYIAAHLSEKITLCDLSGMAMYSPFYCARIFKELTGLAPADYIRRLRLSRSATHSVVIPMNMQSLLFRFHFSPHMA